MSGLLKEPARGVKCQEQIAVNRQPSLARSVATWPVLDEIGLRPEELAERAAGIGGSDANTIFSGDAARVLRLWRQKRG